MSMTDLVDWLNKIEPIRLWVVALAGPILTVIGFVFIAKQVTLAKNNYEALVNKNVRDHEEAKHDLRWKKAEFIAKQAKDFFEDKRVERVIYMLDWSVRQFTIPGTEERKILVIHDDVSLSQSRNNDRICEKYISTENYIVLSKALRIHNVSDVFSESEQFIRDEFDWFFFRLGVFGQLIRSEIISYDEIDGHLSYVIDLICDRGPELGAALQSYIRNYGFSHAAFLIQQKQSHPRA